VDENVSDAVIPDTAAAAEAGKPLFQALRFSNVDRNPATVRGSSYEHVVSGDAVKISVGGINKVFITPA